MKASNYNFFYEKDDEYLAYNSRSNALAVITKVILKNIMSMLSLGNK